MSWKDISMKVLIIAPGESLDYVFDWAPHTNGRPGALTDWLAEGDSIASADIDAETGPTVSAGALVDSNTGVRITISDISAAMLGREYTIDCQITTDNGLVATRRLIVRVLIK